jgi:hypothetical protein
LVPGKRYAVFSIRTSKKNESIWIRAGYAYVQPDDSMNLYLDVLPIDGHLHVRETGIKKAQLNDPKREQPAAVPAAPAGESMGGH